MDYQTESGVSSGRPDPRRTALEVLTEVHLGGAYANLILPRYLADSGLDERDRGFVTELVYGTLRREGEVDVVIARAARREVEGIDLLVLDVLRLGVYQLLYLRVPDHAAVDQSVRLAKTVGAHKASGFINAVLRNTGKKGVEHWSAVIASAPGLAKSHPTWIASEIERALATTGSSGELNAALEAHNVAPLVTLACLPGFSEPTSSDTATKWSPLGVVLESGNPLADERAAAGTARVQDEGSQLAALLLTRARALETGDHILDMCAGPGGKTAVLGAEALQAGASVSALEAVAHRVGLVRDSTRAITKRDATVLTISQGDARHISGAFSHILLDAPCSGLGALRRRPEARWKKSHDQLAGLNVLQAELLHAGLSALALGGVLAYVTCSPVVSETSEIIEAAIATHPEIELMDTPEILDRVARRPVPGARRGSAVQLWTHRHGTDSMFIQLLRRSEGG